MGETGDLREFFAFTAASAVPFAVLACGFAALGVGSMALGMPSHVIMLADGAVFAVTGGAYCVRLMRRSRIWEMLGVAGLFGGAAVGLAVGVPGALGL